MPLFQHIYSMFILFFFWFRILFKLVFFYTSTCTPSFFTFTSLYSTKWFQHFFILSLYYFGVFYDTCEYDRLKWSFLKLQKEREENLHVPSFFSGFDLNLTVNTDMASVVKAMAQPDSGLEIRDRMWLKITIPNAFIGTALWYNNLIILLQ